MNKYLQHILSLNKFNIIIGNLNIDMNKMDALQNKMKNIILKYGLKISNNFNTRISGNSQTKIDVILSNHIEAINCTPLNGEDITDHETISIKILNNEIYDKNENEILSWKKYTKDKLIENIRNCSWHDYEKLSIEEKACKIRENLVKATEPSIERKIMNNQVIKKNGLTMSLEK